MPTWFTANTVDHAPAGGKVLLAINNTRMCSRDANGTLHAVWTVSTSHNKDGGLVLRYGTTTPGNPWTIVDQRPVNIGHAVMQPTLAKLPGGNGRMLRAWIEDDGSSNSHVMAQETVDYGVSWGVAQELARDTSRLLKGVSIDLFWSAAGAAAVPTNVACWRRCMGYVSSHCTGSVIECITWPFARPLTATQTISGSVVNAQDVSVDGRHRLVFVAFDDQKHIYVNRSTDLGVSWGTPHLIPLSGGAPRFGNDPSVAIRPEVNPETGTGDIYVGYQRNDNGMKVVLTKSVDNGMTFAYPTALSATNGALGPGYFAHVITKNAPPEVLVVWEHTTSVPLNNSAKRLGLMYSTDDMTDPANLVGPFVAPGSRRERGRLRNAGCLGNGYLDIFWVRNNGKYDELFHQFATIP